MFKSLILLLFINCQVCLLIFGQCFDGVSFTVYRDSKKVVLQLADTVNDEIFATEISAEHQRIPVLQSGCFRNLPNLQYIIIKQCGLSNIQKSAFLQLPKLRVIHISLNNIEVIRNGIFNSFGIVQLSLEGNGIREVEQHAFYNLTSLEILDLSHNNLYSLNPNVFFKTNNLRQIKLNDNKLLFIYDYFFVECFGAVDAYDSLIDLSDNNISEINKNTFKGVYYINNLLLSDNSIVKISPNAFSDVIRGDSLDLRNNVINKVPNKVLYGSFEEVLYDEDPVTDEFDEIKEMDSTIHKANMSSDFQNNTFTLLTQ